jgi:predicted phosphodiesterase
MTIKEININRFPCVLFSDSHCNLANIRKLKELYPESPVISLGDFTFLFAKDGDEFNKYSIQYFIDNNIPVLEGNHESFLVASSNNDKFVTQRVLGKPPDFNLSKEHLQFLENLPRGFKLILPNGLNYYCFHNLPKDLWSFPDKITEEQFKHNYTFDSQTIGVIQGHLHLNKVDNFSPRRYVVGQLCDGNHHTGQQNGRNYLLLTEKGIEYKKL